MYKGTNARNETIAAKTIDGKLHPRILQQEVEKLTELNHKNIVRIFDFHKEEETFWIFLEFCGHGDLNVFFQKQNLDFNSKLGLMQGIAAGIAYLHEHNIIHRDIKPGNILIASESPLVPKLSDFDLSKFLDADIETSVMSSNVGTLAFKSPEFFNRIGGRLRYHRNVDIYAAGLTFLAMAQSTGGSRKLIPQIETP